MAACSIQHPCLASARIIETKTLALSGPGRNRVPSDHGWPYGDPAAYAAPCITAGSRQRCTYTRTRVILTTTRCLTACIIRMPLLRTRLNDRPHLHQHPAAFSIKRHSAQKPTDADVCVCFFYIRTSFVYYQLKLKTPPQTSRQPRNLHTTQISGR